MIFTILPFICLSCDPFFAFKNLIHMRNFEEENPFLYITLMEKMLHKWAQKPSWVYTQTFHS